MDKYIYTDKEIETIVQDFKSSLFDIVSSKQDRMNFLEQKILNATDAEEEENLRNVWANYHDAVKVIYNSCTVLSQAMQQLDECSSICEQFVEGKKIPPVVGETVASTEASETIPQSKDEEDAISPVQIVEEQDTKEQSLEDTLAAFSNAVAEEAAPVKSVPKVDTETTTSTPATTEEKEDTVPVATATTPVTTEVKEDTAPVATTTTPATTEEKEDTVPVATTTPATTEVKEDTAPVATTTTTEVIPTTSTEASSDVIPLPAEIEIPVVGQVNDISSDTEVAAMPVIQLPSMEEDKNVLPEGLTALSEEKVEDNFDLLKFVRADSNTDKAILVTQKQVGALRRSRDTQTALLSVRSDKPALESGDLDETMDDAETVPENVTESQLEEMMDQLSDLYKNGETDKAEALSAQISVLSKKLPTA